MLGAKEVSTPLSTTMPLKLVDGTSDVNSTEFRRVIVEEGLLKGLGYNKLALEGEKLQFCRVPAGLTSISSLDLERWTTSRKLVESACTNVVVGLAAAVPVPMTWLATVSVIVCVSVIRYEGPYSSKSSHHPSILFKAGSFPTVTEYAAHFTVSPSLWRFSSSIFSDGKLVRKSMSSLESNERKREVDSMSEADYAEEGKMDMLWEDFNEELQSESSLGSGCGGGSDSETSDETGTAKGQRATVDQKMSKTSRSNGMACPKIKAGGSGSGMQVVVMKVLKKLFLLHNKAQLKKNKS
ncbi:hypothetical protein F0562_013002 [Nyssa sinensis]|uniref:Uncharacterized protein n=1 Tax=Nyssa sinensis TaxID=561372 RepID=A0A5J4ZXT9_9ASTE|nr:hypothetical protein F0562_013002 [Nyssa sinensis]